MIRNVILQASLIAGLCLAGRVWAQAPETFGEPAWGLPPNVGTFHDTDWLFFVISVMTGVVGAGVFVVLIAFLIKYRYRPGRNATFSHGNPRLEVVWTLVPTIILAWTAAVSQKSWSEIRSPSSMPTAQEIQRGDAIEVRVIGKQFLWNFQYPGIDGKFGERRFDLIDPKGDNPDAWIGLDRTGPGRDDLVTLNKLVVPVNKKVLLHVNSVDVLHSFFLINFRMKLDAVPGMEGKVWIKATQTSAEVVGTGGLEAYAGAKPFDIVCAELCGAAHYTMRGKLYVVSEEDYQQFLIEEAEELGLGDEEGGDY